MRKFSLLAIFAVITAMSLCMFYACTENRDDDSLSGSEDLNGQIELAVPELTLNEDFGVTWTEVEDATAYVVNVNGEDLLETAERSFSAMKIAGSYTIKVKAKNTETVGEYSQTVEYSVYSVTLATGEGFTLTGDKIVYGGKKYTFTLSVVGEAYQASTPVVKVNGVVLEKSEDGNYTVKNVAENLSITVEGVQKTEFNVTLSQGDGYTVNGEAKVAYGENYTFTVEKSVGYENSTLAVKSDGVTLTAAEDGKTYTVENVTAALEITIEGAVKNTYGVTLPESVAFTVTGEKTVMHGANYSFVLVVSEKYDSTGIAVKANGVALIAAEDGKTYTIENVTAALEITIEGINVKKYDVTLAENDGFTLNGGAVVEHGAKYTFTLTVAEGYTDSTPVVKANDVILTVGEDGETYTVENVTGNLNVTVSGVEINTYTVAVEAGEGFTAERTSLTVNYGANAEFAIAAENANDQIRVYNGETSILQENGVYTVNSVKSDITLTVKVFTFEQSMILSSAWDNYDGTTMTETQNGLIARGLQFGISSAYIQKAVESGYTHLRFSYVTENKSDSGTPAMFMNGDGTAYEKCYPGQGTARFDFSELKKADGSYANIWMQGRSADWQNAKDVAMTVTAVALFKSDETAKWTKSSPKVYCAIEEDGYIVLDTVYSGNGAYVISTAEWWAKYANNPIAKEVGQNTIVLTGKYLIAGSNSRGAVWGNAGNPVGTVGATPNTEDFVVEYMNDIGYADGNKFYLSLDNDGVYQLKVFDFISSRNSHGGLSVTPLGNNSFTLTMPDGGKFVYAFTQEMKAKGYTKVVITASEYNGGQVWIGNDNWGGGMFTLNSGETKELDLSIFTESNPYLQIFANGAINATFTYEFK